MSARITQRRMKSRRQVDGASFRSRGAVSLDASDGLLAEVTRRSFLAGLGLSHMQLADGQSVDQGRLTGRRIG